jgi:uncharacterized protein YbaR (Trm112 family)
MHDADLAARRGSFPPTAVLACEESRMLPPEVLAMLCCPEDRSALQPAGESIINEINNAIVRRQLRNRAGRILEHKLDGGLAKATGDVIYPIIEGIPVLVREEAIPLNQLASKT